MLPHSLSPLPFLHKGEAIRFFKNGLIGGGGGSGEGGGLEIFGRNGGKPGMVARKGGGGFWNGWDGKFLKSLYIGRWLLTPPILWSPPILLTLAFFVCHPPPHFPVTSNAYPHCSFNCPVSLAEWVIMPYLMYCFI